MDGSHVSCRKKVELSSLCGLAERRGRLFLLYRAHTSVVVDPSSDDGYTGSDKGSKDKGRGQPQTHESREFTCCFGCSNQVNKRHMVFNEQKTPEQYKKFMG